MNYDKLRLNPEQVLHVPKTPSCMIDYSALKASVGSSLDEFLTEEGIYEYTNNATITRILSYQLEKAMEERNLTKSAFAEQIGISHSALDRLLDPDNDSVTLETLKKAARVTGQRFEVRLVSG